MSDFYQKIEMNDATPTREAVKALVNVVNFLSREMSIGRVPQNKESADEGIKANNEVSAVLLSAEEQAQKEQAAAELRKAIQYFTATLTDETAMMEIASVYPAYAVGVAYKTGEVFQYGQNSVGDAQLYKVLQDHTSAEEWTPDTAASLYKAIGISEGIPVWVQPLGASDAYNTGDTVMYNGVKYESTIDGNVWCPEDYPQGWKEVSEEVS